MKKKEIAILKRKRGIVKTKLATFATYVESILQKYENCGETTTILSDREASEFGHRLDIAGGYLSEFEETHFEIVSGLDDDNADEDESLATFQDMYFSKIAEAKEIFKRLTLKSNTSLNTNNFVNAQNLQNVKLPQIKLPTFGGSYDDWMEYRDTFNSLIHCNPSIASPIDKFHYLRASLIDKALDVIKNIEFSAQNYELAWKFLCDRYNNIPLLIKNHLRAIFDMDSAEKGSARDIRRVFDTFTKNLRCLKTLGEPVDSWSTLLVHIATAKLDPISNEEWEKFRYSNNSKDSTFEVLLEFLKNRAELLDTMEVSKTEKKVEGRVGRTSSKSFVATKNDTQNRCTFCKADHFANKCPDFLKLTVNDRIRQTKQKKLCMNCLRNGHFVKECRSGNCRHCDQRHHSLLHLNRETPVVQESSASSRPESSVSALSSAPTQSKFVLLSTAKVHIIDNNGRKHNARALLDNGSQSNYITTNLCNKLDLSTNRVDIRVDGISNFSSKVSASCIVRIASTNGSFKFDLDCLVIPQITGTLPNFSLDKETIDIPQHITLSDPSFFEPGEIDLLIGAELFWKLTRIGQIHLSNGPIFQNTALGWIVAGPLTLSSLTLVSAQCFHTTNVDLDQQLQKFWEINEPSIEKPLSPEEKECEKLFVKETYRDYSGRFVVSFPFKRSPELLGDSYEHAKRMFQFLERKFDRNIDLKTTYSQFMQVYEDLGHMSKVEENSQTKPCYYLPHHGVLNENSLTTKLRVVFNGSAVSDSGTSLNDLQMIGPVIQNDLLSILIRFRLHRYVLSSDIEKMYRQVLIKPEHRKFQRILWRKEPSLPIDIFELNTVTYGTTSASFLATRCLYQLALECKHSHPKVSQIIENDFYVDDLLTGTSEKEEGKSLVCQLISILNSGGFPLKKWVSNEPTILECIPEENKTFSLIDLNIEPNIKTLGLFWNPLKDSLCFTIHFPKQDRITKRSILSDISRIFDPLGLLSPCTILSKILVQQLWLEKIDWDVSLPLHLHHRWHSFRNEFSLLNLIDISRYIVPLSWDLRDCQVELHGFSDASEAAYGSCVYVRVIKHHSNEIHVSLLSSKARVAPLKTSTIPRLELCGALVMVNLLDKIKTSLKICIDYVYCWTDSKIVLGWIKSLPSQFQIFVANRISQIQSLSEDAEWNHVPTRDNPADVISRGVMPSSLNNLHSWWKGPQWLSLDSSFWPKNTQSISDLPELRRTQVNVSVATEHHPIFNRFSKLSKLERVMSYLKRFISNSRKKLEERQFGQLTVQERKEAFLTLLKLSQRDSFPNELQLLSEGKAMNLPNRMLSLNPFLDAYGFIRVGGRLDNSDYAFSKKHPLLLASSHRFSLLLFESEHLALMHSGPQMLLASIREKFWPLQGRNLARKVVRSCVRCFRVRPRSFNPLMGNLPHSRISESFPFSVTGLDFAGPFLIKDKPGRGSKNSKCYLCLFVCFSTKAVHLELVSSLTTEAFIAAFRRFSSRRGLPVQLQSDNGTTFVGAKSELHALGSFLKERSSDLASSVSELKVDWKFIPAYSPHFGGMWEAGVKSAKHHLKRIAGNAALTFEELSTLFIQIEAILNSRPLTPLSSDPNDLVSLTPAHFLVGRTLTAVPDYDFVDIPENRLSRFQRLQQLQQQFWSRWRREYISELQQRAKWRQSSRNLEVGTLVVLKEDNTPPLIWKLGRIFAVHPGSDGAVRCVSIRTSNGITKRCVSKLCALPTLDN